MTAGPEVGRKLLAQGQAALGIGRHWSGDAATLQPPACRSEDASGKQHKLQSKSSERM